MLLEATLRIRAGSQICFTYEQIGADPERDTSLHCAACARPRKKKKTEKTKKKAEDGSLFSKDGTVPTAKQHEPTKSRLFFN